MNIEAVAQSSGRTRAVADETRRESHRPALVDVSSPNIPVTAPEPVRPRYRAILALDIESSTSRTDPAKAELRRTLYRLLEEAFGRAGIKEHHRDALVDRGDGVLALIHPLDEIPKTLLLHPVIPILTGLLAEHNSRPMAVGPSDRRIRVRVVVHAGEVHQDRRGNFGEALDIAFRLLDSPQTKSALRRTQAPLVLVVSGDIYHAIVRHGYEGIEADAYVPRVQVKVIGRSHQGWVLRSASSGGRPPDPRRV